MARLICILALCLLGALPAQANSFAPINDQARFLQFVEGRELRLGLFRIFIRILSDGRIEGSALGWDMKGNWSWKDGFFCRDIDWSGTQIPYNCQLVEVRGDDEIRFTVDQGAGDSASFSLR